MWPVPTCSNFWRHKSDFKQKCDREEFGARAWTRVILAGKRGSRHHSTKSFSKNVVVAETSYQMLEKLSFLYDLEIV